MITPAQLDKHFDLISIRGDKRTYGLKDGLEAITFPARGFGEEFKFDVVMVNTETDVQVVWVQDRGHVTDVILSKHSRFEFYRIDRVLIEC